MTYLNLADWEPILVAGCAKGIKIGSTINLIAEKPGSIAICTTEDRDRTPFSGAADRSRGHSASPGTICRRRAMNTLFEIVTVNDDLENAGAAAEAALDEISRIENLLSRFDRGSETSRINCRAATSPVLVDLEMGRLLAVCLKYHAATGGHFDVCANLAEPRENPAADPAQPSFEFDEASRLIRFTRSGARLDFGAIGKGYALDRAAGILAANGITDALLHGGTSSVLAMGRGADGLPWRIGIRDPIANIVDREIGQLELSNQALSTSAVFGPGQENSDLINPLTGIQLSQPGACVVIGTTGTETEALSTAALSMGKTAALDYCRTSSGPELRLGWINHGPDESRLEWLA